jgi:hypothetical protein
MQSNLIVEAKRAAEGFDLARQNNNEGEAERAARKFLDHMMSLENPFPEEANTLSDPDASPAATGSNPDLDGEKARLSRKKEEVEQYLQGLSGNRHQVS